jgi:molybdopterin-synthase adenylyltransferase
MSEIVLTGADATALKSGLLAGEVEHCAIIYAAQALGPDGSLRFLVREIELPGGADYAAQGELEAELRPDYVARIAKRALRAGLSLIFAHSHLGPEAPQFSAVDDEGERRLARFLDVRYPGSAHAALVISRGGVRARKLGTRIELRVVAVGERLEVLFDPRAADGTHSERFDRQVRAFGESGQRCLERQKVAIIGLGGTGSIIAEQLSHLGIRSFILIDPDVIEITNLNRIVGATLEDVGRAKVDVARDSIHRVASQAHIESIQGDVVRARTARHMSQVDFIFGCTDSHGSRAVLQQVAYQYLIPAIDLGSTITTQDGKVTGIFGRVQLLAPGLACLNCSGLLDSEEVRRDMMSPFERKLDPYITGERVVAPAVISLNGTAASLAVTMFMAVVIGIPSRARHLIYNALSSTLRSVRAAPADNCYICSRYGALARGDSVALYARND